MLEKVLVIVCLAVAPSVASADLVFLGFNTDYHKIITVGLLDPLPAGVPLRFSDHEWNGGGFTEDGGDSYLGFAPNVELPAGTVLTIELVDVHQELNVARDGFGQTVPGVFSNNGSLAYLPLQNSSEGVFAYFGPSFQEVATPLASLRTNIGGGILFGAGVDFAGTDKANADTVFYVGPTSVDGTFSEFIELTSDPENWRLIDNDGLSGYPFYQPPTGMLSAVAAIPEPSGVLFGSLLAAGLYANQVRRGRQQGRLGKGNGHLTLHNTQASTNRAD